MPEDPRAKLFFDQWERDTHEGITLRAVHNRLLGHMDRTEQRFSTQSGEMKRIGERVAKVEQNDQRDAEDRAHTAAASWHATPGGGTNIPTPVQPFAVPFAVQMPSAPVVHVHGGQGGSVGGDYIGPGAQVASGSGAHIIPPPAMVAAAALAPAADSTGSLRRSFRPGPMTWLLKAPLQKLGYALTALVTAGVTLVIHTSTPPAPAAPPPRVIYVPTPELSAIIADVPPPPPPVVSSDAGLPRHR